MTRAQVPLHDAWPLIELTYRWVMHAVPGTQQTQQSGGDLRGRVAPSLDGSVSVRCCAVIGARLI
jgi:hypothetical protein